jgi:hypothetical protein
LLVNIIRYISVIGWYCQPIPIPSPNRYSPSPNS